MVSIHSNSSIWSHHLSTISSHLGGGGGGGGGSHHGNNIWEECVQGQIEYSYMYMYIKVNQKGERGGGG